MASSKMPLGEVLRRDRVAGVSEAREGTCVVSERAFRLLAWAAGSILRHFGSLLRKPCYDDKERWQTHR